MLITSPQFIDVLHHIFVVEDLDNNIIKPCRTPRGNDSWWKKEQRLKTVSDYDANVAIA